MEEDKVKIFNVGLLSVAFLIIFAAFQPVTNIQTVILDSAANSSSKGMYFNSRILWGWNMQKWILVESE